MASVGTGHQTHLTADAVTTLCGNPVTDLPEQAGVYCVDCVDAEFALLAAPSTS